MSTRRRLIEMSVAQYFNEYYNVSHAVIQHNVWWSDEQCISEILPRMINSHLFRLCLDDGSEVVASPNDRVWVERY